MAPWVDAVKDPVWAFRLRFVLYLVDGRAVPADGRRSPVWRLRSRLGTQAIGFHLLTARFRTWQLVLLLELFQPHWIIDLRVTLGAA